jgi:hypothetical protein
MVTWYLRYRLRVVETVEIKTFTRNEAEAREVAQRYLDSLQSPSVVLVYVREACVDSSENYPDLVLKWSPEAQAKVPHDTEPLRTVQAKRKEPLPEGRVGA